MVVIENLSEEVVFNLELEGWDRFSHSKNSPGREAEMEKVLLGEDRKAYLVWKTERQLSQLGAGVQARMAQMKL